MDLQHVCTWRYWRSLETCSRPATRTYRNAQSCYVADEAIKTRLISFWDRSYQRIVTYAVHYRRWRRMCDSRLTVARWKTKPVGIFDFVTPHQIRDITVHISTSGVVLSLDGRMTRMSFKQWIANHLGISVDSFDVSWNYSAHNIRVYLTLTVISRLQTRLTN